ncbi:hypothetical protein GUJ93_ZPchr0013g37570 [Zizania palustris]|uniref:HMA domain-containing protein n=1 Tax=Zizania palustris TaxID=103762 RepID=A0A8J5X135_ZIZPA|nr:hypothetical protein GUJ93_ZPchr0013g37570 [Zizania palustris]
MADKISTVVLRVDLECDRCYRKIRRVICRIQDEANIKTISYDEKGNAVTVSGPFDAEEVCRKLCCKAGGVIKEMEIKGGKENKESKGKEGDKVKAEKPAAKKEDGGKAEKKDGGGKPEKEAKADKAAAKAEKEVKAAKAAAKPEKKVKFDLDDAPPAAAAGKPVKAMPPSIDKADLAPLLQKMMIAKQRGPEPPRGEPIAPPRAMAHPVPAAQGVAVPSIWPAPAGSMSCYNYNPAPYDQSSYYGGYGCGAGVCRCGSCGPNPAPGGYYGVPPAPKPYDHQGWYYGNRHPYYQQQQCSEDPNAGCSLM